MKKSLFVLGVAVAALASCTNEEVVNIAESNQIQFGTSFVGNQTKVLTRADNNGHVAPDMTKDALAAFYVYGTKNSTDATGGTAVFENVEVTKTATGSWDYTNHQTWDETNQYYQFAAYAGKKLNNVTFTWDSGLSFQDVTIDGKDDQYDFLATSSNVEKDVTNISDVTSATVNFTLDHLLSKIQFTLKSGFGDDATVKISNFKFYNMKTQGDCSFNTTWGWTVEGEGQAKESTTFSHDTEVAAIGVAANAGEGTTATNAVYSWLVIPQQIKGTNDSDPLEMISFDVTVTGTVGEQENQEIAKKTITAKLPAVTWLANNVYNYNLVINETVMEMDNYILFGTPTINAWGSAIDDNIDNTEAADAN